MGQIKTATFELHQGRVILAQQHLLHALKNSTDFANAMLNGNPIMAAAHVDEFYRRIRAAVHELNQCEKP